MIEQYSRKIPRSIYCALFLLGFAFSCSAVLAEQGTADGFYLLGNENISLCLIASEEDWALRKLRSTQGPVQWRELQNLKQQTVHVSSEVCIFADHFEGAFVKFDSTSSQYIVSLFTKRDVWDAVYSWTKEHLGRQIGIVSGDQVLNSARLEESFAYQCSFIRWEEKALQLFLRNFDLQDERPGVQRRDEYLSWIYSRAEKSANSAERIKAASLLIEGKRFAQAAELLEPVVQEKNSENYMFAITLLGKAYRHQGQLGKAIGLYKKVIQDVPAAWHFRRELAALFEEQHNYQMAYTELKQLLRMQEVQAANCELEKQLTQIKCSDVPTAVKRKLIQDLEEHLEENRKLLGRRK